MSRTRWSAVALVGLFAVTSGCDEYQDCLNEEAVQEPVSTDVPPDFEMVIEIPAEYPEEEWEDGGKVEIRSWDCLDVSWWNSAQPQKVVQILVDATECERYERALVEYYACGAHEGADVPFRDYDGDGFTPNMGDCDDLDASVVDIDNDGDGTSDCVDDDGDGASEREGDPDDLDPSVRARA